MRHWLLSRTALDAWFPTLVRYLGVAAMAYGLLNGNNTVITAATGMILFKTVYGTNAPPPK